MENTPSKKLEKKKLRDTLIYHPHNLKTSSFPPPLPPPINTIVNLTPKNMIKLKKDKLLHTLKLKEPKFVPYEPYKAAVNPIIPYDTKRHKKGTKNNLDINEMVAQMSLHKSIEMKKNADKYTDKKIDKSNDNNDDKILNDWEIEKSKYELEIKNLKEENSQLENQLKFQAQVNGELKNLLVAAVGEDLETRVNLLTEDKLQLSKALLNSAKYLSTHQEQIEWLAGQCEVWRSKFLASSLMVEELAKWKAGLSQRTTDLQEGIKRLLEEHCKVRDVLLKTYRILSLLRENFDPVGAMSFRRHELPSTNIQDLSNGCCQVSEILKIQLLSGMDHISLQKDVDTVGLDMKTIGEKNVEQLLMNSNLLIGAMQQDAACSAVMGAAVAVGGSIFLPARNEPNISCCGQCSGDIKQV